MAGVYIIISSLISEELSTFPEDVAIIELAKGLIFVVTTGLLLFVGFSYLLKRMSGQNAEIEKQRASLLMLDQRASSGLLASAIGHDANNLLATIKLTVDMLKIEREEARRLKMLSTVSEVVDELVNLNSRLVQGGESDQSGELKEHCLREEARRVLDFLDEHHPIRKLRIEFTGMDTARAEINRNLYTQVVLNLLTNVARHAGSEAKTRLHFDEEDDSVVIEVHDDGPGVNKSDNERIFEPYYTRHSEGSGLGLASVKAIMRLHRGEVEYKPSSLGGACFKLRFPKNPELAPQAT